jgi:hypothetical protein
MALDILRPGTDTPLPGYEFARHLRIPATERLAAAEGTCGVCSVDPRRGRTTALLRFESRVQEVFAVAVLPRRFPDLINDNDA